jgi:L-alanine-DL-glutamate epimerase-like enolase superfamily enzyme
MITITSVGVDHYRIPLPVVLSDSTHGDIAEFELVTVRIRDDSGIEGLGYTYTVGRGGGAVAALIKHDLCPILVDAEPDRTEALWQRMWWAVHYGGRGGFASLAISAVDIALWDLKARRFGTPLWRLLGGLDPRVPAYAGGIDLESTKRSVPHAGFQSLAFTGSKSQPSPTMSKATGELYTTADCRSRLAKICTLFTSSSR